jgi:hypothetical protein
MTGRGVSIDTPPCKIQKQQLSRALQGGVCKSVLTGPLSAENNAARYTIALHALFGAMMLGKVPLHTWLFTPELQWQSRGNWRVLPGCAPLCWATEKCQFDTEKCQFDTEKC